MILREILARAGKHKSRKRVGRGPGSGMGKTSARGTKGAKSRSGWKRRLSHEGGQTTMIRRLPKRGFSNSRFRVEYDIVNVCDLEVVFEVGDRVDLAAVVARGLLKSRHGRLKVLGHGELTKRLSVLADRMSGSARTKIEQAGGTVELAAE